MSATPAIPARWTPGPVTPRPSRRWRSARTGAPWATGSADTTTRLWDVSDPHHPALLGTLTGHTNTVESVAFSSDGHTLATGSDDTTARLWDTNVDRVAARICHITPASTKAQWAQYLPGLAYRPPCS
jgi:predicted NACHT family NTPase